MKAPNKQDVITYLKSDRTLTGGKNLYNKMIGRSLAIQNGFNRMTDTTQNKAIMYYEIGKLVGITEREIKIYTSKPIAKAETKAKEIIPIYTLEERVIMIDPNASREELLQQAIDLNEVSKIQLPIIPKFAKGLPGNKEMIAFLNENGIVPVKKKKKDLLQEIELYKTQATEKTSTEAIKTLLDYRDSLISKKLNESPIEVKQTLKLYEQFPFLRDKDCPDVYKILVNDMITAYTIYTEEQPLLFSNATLEELAKIAATVKNNFIENKDIWEELEYYQENKTPLGKHAIFFKMEVEKNIQELSAADLNKKVTNLRSNISRNKKKSKDKKRSEDERDASKVLYEKQQAELDIALTELDKRS
ncbi:hypothetical protein [Aquimarina megaterium]|uniref:hypothetical protein n=1 Tax=Aquimarina megaterium TaxID=1443666 RepID=UPI00094484A1|nr:hypothetical protein [Aquimarina megaterium]